MSALLTAMRRIKKCYASDDTAGVVVCYDAIIKHIDIPGYPKDVAEKVAEFVVKLREMQERAKTRQYVDGNDEYTQASNLMDKLSYEVFMPWLRSIKSPFGIVTGGGGDA